MDANSKPPNMIHLSSTSPGSSLPIRAPLTIDSDDDHIHSRTSSFSSTSSIDFSSYGDEQISVHDERQQQQDDDDTFVPYPDEEIVIESSRIEEHPFTRPYVKYQDGDFVYESAIFRASVKIPHEGTSGALVTDIGIFSPVARLTGDSDSDSDIGSVDDGRWSDSGRIPVGDEIGHEELQFEGLCFSEHINESDAPLNDSVSAESTQDDGLKVESLNEAFNLSEPEERKDSYDIKTVHDPPTNDYVSTESIQDNGPKVEYMNEAQNRAEPEERIDSYVDIKTVHDPPMKDSVSAESIQDNGRQSLNEALNRAKPEEPTDSYFDVKTVHDPPMNDSVSVESIQDNGPKVESLDEALNRSEPEERTDSYFHIKTVHETDRDGESDHSSNKPNKILSENEDQMPLKMHPIRSKLINLVKEDDTNKFNSCLTILTIGKTGVGKSATINSILGENKAFTNPFQPATNTINEIIENINGIKLRVVDTPGFSSSPSDQSYNMKILLSIKKFIQKHTPDLVLYVDRLDTYGTDINDSRLLGLITLSLGSSLWHNCVLLLTHAGFSNPDEDSGRFVFERCGFLRELIVSHGGLDRSLVSPVWLVENNGGLMGCEQVLQLKPASELQRVVKERKKVCFEDGGYRVKVFEVKKWRVVCGLCLCVKWRCR